MAVVTITIISPSADKVTTYAATKIFPVVAPATKCSYPAATKILDQFLKT